MKAVLRNYRQSPRKVRLVTDLVRGRSVGEAVAILKHTTKRASLAVSKLIQSAAANAEQNFKVDPKTLKIGSITVDQGLILKRSQPRSKGMATPIHKHNSHIAVILSATHK